MAHQIYIMAKFKFILLCAILLCTITTYAQPAQYTPMTAAGYQMKRLKIDSTLHPPSFCGIPTLRGSTLKDGALAIDTCNVILYMWTYRGGWDTVNAVGSKIDTTSLSNRINLKLSISDTASMLSPYLREIDTASLSNRINLKLSISDTATMLSPYLRSIDTSNKWVNRITRIAGKDSIIYFVDGNRFAIKDSVGNGGGSGQNGRFGNDTATIVMAKVHNDAGVVLTNGKVVTFSTSGTNSNAPSVKLANNKHDSTSANTLGFVSGTIAINDTGWVILSGHIEKLNTSAFANGDVIYLDSISGQWTKSKPKAPYHMVYLGVVVKSNAGNGSIFVKCQNGYELSEIHDVQINNPVNNQLLAYSDTQSLWKNRNIYSIVDTTNIIATKSNVALKLNISDTASMLSNYQKSLTFSTGLTNTSGTITSNLSTGVSGGQSIVGGTAASNSLTLSSTSNATKGKLLFGTSAYDEVNNRLGVGTATPATTLDVIGKANIEYSATTDFPLIIKNSNASAATSNVLSFDCSATGADQPVFINLASANAKGMSFFASNQAITSSPVAAGFQMFSTSSTNFPGQMYFDAGANNNSSIIFRTAQTAGTIAQRMRIFANGNVSISSSATNPNQTFSVAGVSQATQFKLSALNTAPASATATGTLGEIRIVNGFIYVCVATNTWQRTALTTW